MQQGDSPQIALAAWPMDGAMGLEEPNSLRSQLVTEPLASLPEQTMPTMFVHLACSILRPNDA